MNRRGGAQARRLRRAGIGIRIEQESLDETIDRVAAHLTMVPADPALAGRIAEQLDRDAPFAWYRLAIASAAVAVLVATVVLLNDSRDLPATEVARTVAPPPSSDAPAPRDAAPRDSDPAAIASAAISSRSERAAVEEPEPLPEMPQIASLAPPVTLAVDTLSTDTLTIEPVDLAPLDVADLAVSEIGERDSPKE
jgi:hypothetical protein